MYSLNRRSALKTLGAMGCGSLASRFTTSLNAGMHPMNKDTSDIPASLNRTGWELFRKLDGANVLISPASIGLALAMTERGAGGQTRDEMRQVLHFSPENPQTDPGFASLVDQLGAEKPGRQIRVANRLFAQKDFAFYPEFTSQVRDWFHAPLEQVDFINQSEQARQRINDWVEQQTRKMIKDLVPSGIFTPLTRLVLANAIHFKGEWQLPFLKSGTHAAPFETAPGQKIEVPRMNQKKRFAIRETAEAEALEMPCKGLDRSVHFILPKKRHGLANLIETLDPATFAKQLLFSQAKEEETVLGLPKFKIESKQTLNTALAELGMPSAFSVQKADFSGMNSTKQPLKIDAVLHKAVLVVDELGAEAAAATAVVMGLRSAPAKMPRTFTVDQPFLVAITDKATQSVLFLGKVAEPGKV